MKIAMWSGPRNLSTAMMYSFGVRSDCAIVDEPYYAAYLANTGFDHPMRSEILATQSCESLTVADILSGSIPDNMPHFYQKHMTHHILPGFDLDWMANVRNVFLIRHPARVIASYVKKRERPSFDDLGFRQQMAVYRYAVNLGQQPVVVDSDDIRGNPRATLSMLCDAIGVPYQEEMLTWPAGGHACDGIWAKHWYGAVHRSTGFAGAEGPLPVIPDALQPTLNKALEIYEVLAAKNLLRSPT
jgi:hypothetical protein